VLGEVEPPAVAALPYLMWPRLSSTSDSRAPPGCRPCRRVARLPSRQILWVSRGGRCWMPWSLGVQIRRPWSR